jgi:hypothetical protein
MGFHGAEEFFRDWITGTRSYHRIDPAMGAHCRGADFVNFINPIGDRVGTENAEAIEASALFARHNLAAMVVAMFVGCDDRILGWGG